MKTITLMVVTVASLSLAKAQVAQPATSITASLLTMDSHRYIAFAPSDTAEAMIAKHENFDSVNNVYIVGHHLRDEIAGSEAVSADLSFEMKKLVWNSDAIVVATPTRRISALTANHRFVFSDYEVTVNRLLSDRVRNLLVGSQIVVTRPGGEVSVNGAKFRAIETELPLFQIGVPYIFFLHYNELGGSYSLSANDVFAVLGDRISTIKLHPRVFVKPSQRDKFLSEIQSAIDSDYRGGAK